jgi:hypothetical protein
VATRAGQVLNKELDLYAEFWDIVREGQEVAIPELRPPGRFVVLNNIPGYMPEDDDPPYFDTEKEAWDYLVEEVARYVDGMDDDEITVRTYQESGYAEVDDDSLGRVFYVNYTGPCCDGE